MIKEIGKNLTKFCAFGYFYKDRKGIVIKTQGDLVQINSVGNNMEWWEIKNVMFFDTESEVDEWIKLQNYQYDDKR